VAAFACPALSEPEVGTPTESDTTCATVWAATACDAICEAGLNVVWDASCEADMNAGCEAGHAVGCETGLTATGCEGV
jgi:hypothetical protein